MRLRRRQASAWLLQFHWDLPLAFRPTINTYCPIPLVVTVVYTSVHNNNVTVLYGNVKIVYGTVRVVYSNVKSSVQ